MFSKYIKNTESKNFTRGPHPTHEGGGAPYPLGAPPTSWAPWWPSGDHLLLYGVFRWKKIISHLLGRNSAATRRNLGGTKSRALAELFYRGNFPLGGGNHHHRYHQCSSRRERAISINIFTSTISSPNPSSSLVSNSCLEVRDWC